MMRRETGEEALGVREQRLPYPLVPDEVGEAHGVGLVDGPEAVLAPAERPVTPERTRAVAGEVVREQPRTPPPVLRRFELAGQRVARGRGVSPLGVRPRNPHALQPRHGVL